MMTRHDKPVQHGDYASQKLLTELKDRLDAWMRLRLQGGKGALSHHMNRLREDCLI